MRRLTSPFVSIALAPFVFTATGAAASSPERVATVTVGPVVVDVLADANGLYARPDVEGVQAFELGYSDTGFRILSDDPARLIVAYGDGTSFYGTLDEGTVSGSLHRLDAPPLPAVYVQEGDGGDSTVDVLVRAIVVLQEVIEGIGDVIDACGEGMRTNDCSERCLDACGEGCVQGFETKGCNGCDCDCKDC